MEGIATNDAAEGACCKVVAAEELNLLLGFGEGGSHGAGGWGSPVLRVMYPREREGRREEENKINSYTHATEWYRVG